MHHPVLMVGLPIVPSFNDKPAGDFVLSTEKLSPAGSSLNERTQSLSIDDALVRMLRLKSAFVQPFLPGM